MTAVVRGNALHIPLRDESVDLVITSPPYYALRSYRDDGDHFDGQLGSEPTPQTFLEALWAVTTELWRVLKPDGVMFVNLGDKRSGSGGHNNNGLGSSTLNGHGGAGSKKDRERKQANADGVKATRRNAPDRYNQAAFGRPKSKMALPHRYFIGCMDGLADPDGIGWIARQDIVWSKPNGLPESVTDRVRDSHEYWFMLTKQERYFAAVDEVREPHAPQSLARSERNRFAPDLSQDGIGSPNTLDPAQMCNGLGKLPGSVWTIASEPLVVPEWLGVDHFAAFPQEWPRRLILGWSPSGICTACGEGRRPVVAKELEFVRPPQQRKADWTNPHRADGANSKQQAIGQPGQNTATITGYACACRCTCWACVGGLGECVTKPAPTRPAVVLDPFGGTGTVSMVARALGRTGVSLDLSADYCRLAQWRIFQSGHAAKARERTNRENQGSLL